MHLKIDRATLLSLLGHAQNVVERRTTIPILSNIRLDAADANLSLLATDLELMLHEAAAAEVLRAGSTTLPAHTLFDVVRKLPDGVTVELHKDPDQSEAVLRAGRSNFSLPTLPATDFPAMSSEAFERSFQIQGEELARLIDKARFAMSTEEARYYLNGLHFHTHHEGATSVLRAVATDGHRLAKIEASMPEGAEGLAPIIVPRKTVGEIRKLIEGAETVAVSLSSTRIQVRVGSATLISRLIDGTFPDYERVIPSANDKHLSVDTKAFASAVDRVVTVATEKTRAVKLALQPGQMTVTAVSAEAGRGQEEVDVDYTDAPLEIGFNARYVLDMLAQITADTVHLEIASAAAPTLVRDPSDGNATYVLMPMRV